MEKNKNNWPLGSKTGVPYSGMLSSFQHRPQTGVFPLYRGISSSNLSIPNVSQLNGFYNNNMMKKTPLLSQASCISYPNVAPRQLTGSLGVTPAFATLPPVNDFENI